MVKMTGTRFITKGRGTGRKVIPMTSKSRSKVPALDMSDRFYSMPQYILHMTLDEDERIYLQKLHENYQLLNHLRLAKRDLIGHIGDDTYSGWVKLMCDIDDGSFDADSFLKSKGAYRYHLFTVSVDHKFRAVLRAQGVGDRFIDDFLYIYGRHYKFVGIDGLSYDIKFPLAHYGDMIMTSMKPAFNKYIGMSSIFYFRDDDDFKRYTVFIDLSFKDRWKSLSSMMDKKYHEAYKDKKGYLKV
ncbi:hypothetical protein GQ472_01740 [archaeon]|nr:hypothetical protein [archaeon]